MLGRNQKISREDLDFVRSIDDFDLIWLISEISDGGWKSAKEGLLPIIRTALEREKQKESAQEATS